MGQPSKSIPHSTFRIPHSKGGALSGEGVQATRGGEWMPWGQKPKKGAAHGEMLRGAASTLGSGDTRMGKPSLLRGVTQA